MPLSPAGAPSLPLLAGPAAGPVGEALAAALPLPAGAAPAPAQRAGTPAATIDLSPVAVLQHGLETLVAAAKQIGPALADFAQTTAPTPGNLPGSPLGGPLGATPPGPAALRLVAAIELAGTVAQAVGNAIETALPRPVAARQGVAAGQGAAGETAQPAPAAGGSMSPGLPPAPPTAAVPPSSGSLLQPAPLPDRVEQPEGVPLSPLTTPDGATPPRAGHQPHPRLPDTAARRTCPPDPALPSLLLSLLQPSWLPDRTEWPERGPLPLPATPDGATPPRAGQQPLPRLPDDAAGRTGPPDPSRGAIDAFSGTEEALQAVRQHLESVPEDRAAPAARDAAVVQAALLPAEAQLALAAARLVAILPAAPGLAPLRDRARRAAGVAARRPGLAFWEGQGPPSWRELGLLLPLGTAALVAGLLVAADRPLIRAACAAIGLLAGAVLVARRCRKLRLVVAAPARRKDG